MRTKVKLERTREFVRELEVASHTQVNMFGGKILLFKMDKNKLIMYVILQEAKEAVYCFLQSL